MGAIADAVDDEDAADEASPTHADPDPFLYQYDTDKVQLDADTVEQILGVAVVVSNVFN